MTEKARQLRTGQVARLFGVSHDTIAHWVHKGLLPATRTPGGQFRFDADKVLELRERSGYPVGDTRET